MYANPIYIQMYKSVRCTQWAMVVTDSDHAGFDLRTKPGTQLARDR